MFGSFTNKRNDAFVFLEFFNLRFILEELSFKLILYLFWERNLKTSASISWTSSGARSILTDNELSCLYFQETIWTKFYLFLVEKVKNILISVQGGFLGGTVQLLLIPKKKTEHLFLPDYKAAIYLAFFAIMALPALSTFSERCLSRRAKWRSIKTYLFLRKTYLTHIFIKKTYVEFVWFSH